jgi:hypothetical protein
MQGSYIYTLTHTYIVRENKIVLASLSGLWEAGEVKKMLENEKY